MECLWVAFFLRFWWILNAKLASKIHPRWSDLARRGVMARRGEAWRGEAWRGVVRRGVEGVKGVEGRIWHARKTGGRGLTQAKGVYPPQDPRPSPPRGVGDSCCDFFGNLVALLFCIVFRCLFGSILAPVSLPTCLPKSIKIQEKSMPRCHPSWTPFFDRFLVGFGSQLPPPKAN